MALPLGHHPRQRSDRGAQAWGVDAYKVEIEEKTQDGIFYPEGGGISILYGSDKQEQMQDGVVRQLTYQNDTVSLSFSGTFAAGLVLGPDNTPLGQDGDQQANMKKALGVATAASQNTEAWTWQLDVGTTWKFIVDGGASARGSIAANSLKHFNNVPMVLEPNSSFEISPEAPWTMNLNFIIYRASRVMSSSLYSALTGQLWRRAS